MRKKARRRSVAAVLIILITLFGCYVSVFGLGDKIENLGKQMKYGLDINGGVYVLLEAETDEKGTEKSKVMEQTKSVLENRVNAMGISEASVSIEGDNRIRVEMPGVEDADEAIKQIGRTAQLKFLLADGTVVMTGDNVKDCTIASDSDNGGYEINLKFTKKGSELFAEGTEKAVSGDVVSSITDENGTAVGSNCIVIMLDDEIISYPTVEEKINSTTCRITRPGGFEQEEASEMSALIRGGALPATLTEVNSSVETATIGVNALNKSAIAGLIGLGLVMIVMIIAYGLLGVIADFALILYVQLILWIMAAFGSVLTLPGIAGIILSIGMAVDSNVIIFTRIREEISKGKSIRVAVDMGFKSALSTVIDSQTTTLIAAIILYLIGTSSVRGFALTLIIGTVCSIFTAVFITQIFVNLLADSRKFSKMKHFGMKEDGTPKIKKNFYIDFIKNRKVFYIISSTIIIVGIGFAIFKGFNYGIDFTGGTMMQIDMGKQVDIEEVSDAIKDYDLDPTIVYAGEDNTQIIIKTIKALKVAKREEILGVLEDKYGLDDDAVLASEEFGPTVGKDLRENAVKSILLAVLCMLIYIRFRFKNWKYGLAAISGLGHDVLITLSIYAIFGISINNPFIAGILTVVGYSINDTIVVFDRIRENTKFYKRKQNVELINDSINQTLSRTIMTSLTTLIVMVPLLIMVSEQLREFIIPLMIGVFVGTYSSICLCSPLYYELTKKDSLSKYEEKNGRKPKSKRENDGIVV
jgi:SecD/SecF fusion protein